MIFCVLIYESLRYAVESQIVHPHLYLSFQYTPYVLNAEIDAVVCFIPLLSIYKSCADSAVHTVEKGKRNKWYSSSSLFIATKNALHYIALLL